jgi:predicted transcriptional regulator
MQPAATPSRPFVLSIRPTYMSRILEGTKTVELRRRFPEALNPRTVLILYSTSPVQSIVGYAQLEDVVGLALTELWKRFGKAAAVTEDEFRSYFAGASRGFALRIKDVCVFKNPIHLTDLCDEFDFSPPQSYCYWKQPLEWLTSHGRAKITS